RVEAVAGELHAIDRESAFASHVLRKGDAGPVGERAAFAADVHGYRRMARGFDAEHADGLQVLPVVGRGLDAPRGEVVLDIRRRQPDARGVHGTSLQLIRSNVGEPFLQIGALDGRGGAGPGRSDRRGAHPYRSPPADTQTTTHDSPQSRYYSSQLAPWRYFG